MIKIDKRKGTLKTFFPGQASCLFYCLSEKVNFHLTLFDTLSEYQKFYEQEKNF